MTLRAAHGRQDLGARAPERSGLGVCFRWFGIPAPPRQHRGRV